MKNQDFTAAIFVDQKPHEVYDAILNFRKWWSGLYEESFEGSAQKIGDEFSFRAGGGMHYTKQKLIELIPNQKVVWEVIEANLSFVEDTDEWEGTKISFEIIPENDKTKITFTHIGLIPALECYGSCAPAWTQYIVENRLNLND